MNRIKLLLAFCLPVLIAIAGCASTASSSLFIFPSHDRSEFPKTETVTIESVKIEPAPAVPCKDSSKDAPRIDHDICQIDINVSLKDGVCNVQSVNVAPHVHVDKGFTVVQWVIKPIDESGRTFEFADGAAPPIQFSKPVRFTIPPRRTRPDKFTIVIAGVNQPTEYTIYLQFRDPRNNFKVCRIDPIIDNY